MKHVFLAWPIALRLLFRDPVNFVLFLLPALVALLLYAVLGGYVLTKGLGTAEVLIMKYVISKEAGLVLYYIISGLLMFLLFVLVNWTFVLCLGVIAAPFNDMLSARIERRLLGAELEGDRRATLSAVFRRLGYTLKNELKKITVILGITLLAALLNFFPVLFPVAFLCLALLMSAQYLDYSWSRHDLPAGQCLRDVVSHLPANLVSGVIFMVLVSVPFLNALVPAIATSYYTVLWTKRRPTQMPQPSA